MNHLKRYSIRISILIICISLLWPFCLSNVNAAWYDDSRYLGPSSVSVVFDNDGIPSPWGNLYDIDEGPPGDSASWGIESQQSGANEYVSFGMNYDVDDQVRSSIVFYKFTLGWTRSTTASDLDVRLIIGYNYYDGSKWVYTVTDYFLLPFPDNSQAGTTIIGSIQINGGNYYQLVAVGVRATRGIGWVWNANQFDFIVDYLSADVREYNNAPIADPNQINTADSAGEWSFANSDPTSLLFVDHKFTDPDGTYKTVSNYQIPTAHFYLQKFNSGSWSTIEGKTATASSYSEKLTGTWTNYNLWKTADQLRVVYDVTDGHDSCDYSSLYSTSTLTVPNWPASATWGPIPSEIKCTTDITTTSSTNYISVTLSDKSNSVDTDAIYYIEVKPPGTPSDAPYLLKETGSWSDGQILKIPYGWFASSHGMASLKVSFHDGYDTILQSIEKTDMNVKNTDPTVSWTLKPYQGANGEIYSAKFKIIDDTFIPIATQIQFQYQKLNNPAVWYDIVSPINSVDITKEQSLSIAVLTNPATNAYGPIPADILGDYSLRLIINDGFGKQWIETWTFTVTDSAPYITDGPYLYVRDSADNVMAYLDTNQDWYHWDGTNWIMGAPSDNIWLTKNVKLQAVMNIEDLDGQEMVVKFQFKRNGALWGNFQTISRNEFGSFSSDSVTGFQHGDIITYTYEPITLPSTSIGIFTFPIAVIIQDILPVVDSYQINPSSDAAFTDTTLNVNNIAISDADGDSCTYTLEWSINGLIQSNIGQILAAANFYSGQTVELRIIPKSMVGTNQISGKSVVLTWLIQDRPPTVSNVVYPAKPTKSSDLTISITTADLDDNDPATISIYPRSATITWQRWDNELWTDVMVSTVTNPEGSKVLSVSLSNSYFEKGNVMRALIELRNAHSENPSPELYTLFTTTDLVIYNMPSVINDLVYLNSDLNQLYYSTYINAEVEICDIDSADIPNLAVKFDWYKVSNNIPIWTDLSTHIESYAGRYWIQSSLNNTELTRFVHGDSLYVVATAYDGIEWGNMLSTQTNPILIHNTPPQIIDIDWPSGPHAIRRGDTWIISPVVKDCDPDDTSSQHLRFNVQFSILSRTGTTRIVSNDNVATIELSDEYFTHGDQITVQMTPFNFGISENDQAYLYGSSFTIDSVLVLNSLPSLRSGQLSPVSASVDCNASLILVDVDQDIVSAQFEWSVNNQIIAGQITSTLPCQYYKRGDYITLRLRLSDNYDYEFTDWIYLESIQVVNDPPVLVSTQIGIIGDYIDQSQIFRDDVLNLTLTSTDYDEDVVSYYYQWYANGLPVEGATEATFNVTLLSPGSIIFCRITPWDGYSNGTSIDTSSVTVLDAGRYESVDLSMFLRMNPTQMYYFFGLMFATTLIAAVYDKLNIG